MLLSSPPEEIIDVLKPTFSMSLEMSNLLSSINLEKEATFDEDSEEENENETLTTLEIATLIPNFQSNGVSITPPEQYYNETIEVVQDRMYSFALNDFELDQQEENLHSTLSQYRNSSAYSSSTTVVVPQYHNNNEIEIIPVQIPEITTALNEINDNQPSSIPLQEVVMVIFNYYIILLCITNTIKNIFAIDVS
jgi:hypothetical protein